jgi:hypothetical protein
MTCKKLKQNVNHSPSSSTKPLLRKGNYPKSRFFISIHNSGRELNRVRTLRRTGALSTVNCRSMGLHVLVLGQALVLTRLSPGFMSQFSIPISSAKWCHRVAGNFSYLSTQTFFSVSHSVWYELSLPKSFYPGLCHPVGFSGVWARAPSLFWFFVTRVTTRAVLSSESYGSWFWGP